MPLEDRWLAVSISLRLADHHTEHADTLPAPPGDSKSSVYKAKGKKKREEGVKRRSLGAVLFGREEYLNEGHMYDQLQHPSTASFMALLIMEDARSKPYVTFP